MPAGPRAVRKIRWALVRWGLTALCFTTGLGVLDVLVQAHGGVPELLLLLVGAPLCVLGLVCLIAATGALIQAHADAQAEEARAAAAPSAPVESMSAPALGGSQAPWAAAGHPALVYYEINWRRLAQEWPAATVARARRLACACQGFEAHFHAAPKDRDPLVELKSVSKRTPASAIALAQTYHPPPTARTALQQRDQLAVLVPNMLADPATAEFTAALVDAVLVDTAFGACFNLDLLATLRAVQSWTHWAGAALPTPTDPGASLVLATAARAWLANPSAAAPIEPTALVVGAAAPSPQTRGPTAPEPCDAPPDGAVPAPIGRLAV